MIATGRDRWDKRRFAVERKCTCTSRSAECALGWHMVDSHDTRGEALTDAFTLGFDAYRVVDVQTGQQVTY